VTTPGLCFSAAVCPGAGAASRSSSHPAEVRAVFIARRLPSFEKLDDTAWMLAPTLDDAAPRTHVEIPSPRGTSLPPPPPLTMLPSLSVVPPPPSIPPPPDDDGGRLRSG
jgi:hypothetical protein